MSTKIKATFRGTSSLGYEPCKSYNLHIANRKSSLGFRESMIVIWDADDKAPPKLCEYASIDAFLANWTHIVPQLGVMTNLFETLNVLTQTKHPRVVLALQTALEQEKKYLEKPSTRYDTNQIATVGITEKDIVNSRQMATECIQQYESAIKLLSENKFIVGRDDLMEALQNYAQTQLSVNPEKFAVTVIEELEKKN